MWVCPKCGREFRRTNQGHYCGEPPETVLEYIKADSGYNKCCYSGCAGAHIMEYAYL